MSKPGFYVNPNGHELWLDERDIEHIKARGDWQKFTRPEAPIDAKGPANEVLLLMNMNGLGDDIHAMPVVWQKIKDGFNVTVVGREFSKECFTSIGAQFIDENETYPGWIKEVQRDYGVILSLKQWCLQHESETAGYISKDRFEQLAELIGTTIPKKFSWAKTFKLGPRKPRDYTLYSPKSYAEVRTYWYNGAQDIQGEVIEVRPGMYKTFRDLLKAVYEAKQVIAVDNGILNVALALNVPSVGIYGPTDERFISECYGRFHTLRFKSARVTSVPGCFAPCSSQSTRGYSGACKRRAKCLDMVSPQDIAKVSLMV